MNDELCNPNLWSSSSSPTSTLDDVVEFREQSRRDLPGGLLFPCYLSQMTPRRLNRVFRVSISWPSRLFKRNQGVRVVDVFLAKKGTFSRAIGSLTEILQLLSGRGLTVVAGKMTGLVLVEVMLIFPGPPPLGGMYGMPPLMDRYGLGMPMGPAAAMGYSSKDRKCNLFDEWDLLEGGGNELSDTTEHKHVSSDQDQSSMLKVICN